MGKTGGVLVMNSSKPAVIIELYGSNTLSEQGGGGGEENYRADMTTSSCQWICK